jgi:hypothetical protein
MIKSLLAKFRRRSAARRTSYVIPTLEGAAYNACLTDLLNDRTRVVWEHRNLRAAPFTAAVAAPAVAPYRGRALAAYMLLDAAGLAFPLVVRHPEAGVVLRYTDDPAPGEPIRAAWVAVVPEGYIVGDGTLREGDVRVWPLLGEFTPGVAGTLADWVLKGVQP